MRRENGIALRKKNRTMDQSSVSPATDMIAQESPDIETRLHGRWLLIARVGWVVLTRKKYDDAEKTLAAFSTVLRNEVDLNQLREQLIAVVQETMQPAHVSLWLRQPEQGTGEQVMPKPDTD
jgi:hypothetical protein